MLFQNVPFKDAFIVWAITFLFGVCFFFLLFLYLKKKDEYHLHKKSIKRIFKGALVGGVAFSFLFTIIIVTLTPTIITVEDGHRHSKRLSFVGNEGFIGLGGCYVVNNSNQTIHVVGIGSDKDINVIIKPNKTERIRICPEEYFDGTPTNDTPAQHRVTYRRGKRRPIKGHTVFLFDYQNNK